MTRDPIRRYVVLKANREGVIPNYFNPDSAAADEWARTYIAEHVYEGAIRTDPPFVTVARPSNDVHSGFGELTDPPRRQEVVVALNVYGSGSLSSHQAVTDIITAAAAPEKQDIFSCSSPDIPFAASAHWGIGAASGAIFSNRSGAARLRATHYLPQP